MKQLKMIGTVGGAISLALCWPLAVGQIGHNVISDGIAKLSSSAFQAEIVNYDRGYLSSNVQTRYQIIDEGLKQQLVADGLPTEFLVNSKVEHGLMSLTAHSSLVDTPDFPLSLTSTTQLNGNTQYSFALDSWHYATQDGQMVVSTSPATLEGAVTVLGEISYQLDVPSVELDFASGEKMALSQVSGQGAGKQDKGFWLGDQSLALSRLSVVDGFENSVLDVTNATYKFDSSINGELARFSSNHVVVLEKLLSNDGEVNDLNIDFTLGDLDSESLEKLTTLYQNNPALSEQDIQQALPYIESLFAKGFYLSMNKMALKIASGEFESKWKIAVPEGTNDILQDPSIILPALVGNVDTFISNQLVEDFPFIKQGIDELVIMEMMVQEVDGYRLQAEIKQGNLEFKNGKQLPLVALLMPVMLG